MASRDRRGAVEALLVWSAALAILAIPLFLACHAWVSLLAERAAARDLLSVSALSAYHALDRELLFQGVVRLDPDQLAEQVGNALQAMTAGTGFEGRLYLRQATASSDGVVRCEAVLSVRNRSPDLPGTVPPYLTIRCAVSLLVDAAPP